MNAQPPRIAARNARNRQRDRARTAWLMACRARVAAALARAEERETP